MNKSLRFSQGLAQIPLMIVLLIMAIAVPVATKLVQDNADTRNQAAGGLCRNKKGTIVSCKDPSAIVPTTKPGSGGGVINPTPKIATATLPPSGICTADNQCSGPCAYCGSGRCISGCGGVPTFGNPSSAPTTVPPTGVPRSCSTIRTPSECFSISGCTWNGVTGTCGNSVLPTVTKAPTATPTIKICYDERGIVSPCSVPSQAPTRTPINCQNTCMANPNSSACLYCLNANVTPTPVVVVVTPTLAMTDSAFCSIWITNVSCSKNSNRCFWSNVNSKCVPLSTPTKVLPTATKVPTATPTKTYPANCKATCEANPNSSACMYCLNANPTPTVPANCVNTCNAGPNSSACLYCKNANLTPTAKPTVKPTATPTSRPIVVGPTVAPTVRPTSRPTSGGNPTSPPSGCGTQPAEVCTSSNLKVRPQCFSGRWDYDIQLCNLAGRTDTCGGVPYCCPVANGSWTTDMTRCPAATPTVVAGADSVLNYKVSFGGVNPNSAQCVVDWPLQFIVLGGGQSMVYTGVVPSGRTVVGNKLVFSGSLRLVGFNKTSGVAAFISGPKQLQVKYGINNQVAPYNKAGGELTLTSNIATSPVYDFSGYPIIPGDVIGVNSSAQDGWINGVDFSYVKSKSLIHETVASGGYLQGDLDGNCQVNSNDVNLLKISLQDKQGQLY